MDEDATDRELLERWREGDLIAARRLFARHGGSVGRVFRYKADDAIEDLVQQTFLHCLERRDAIDERGLRGYLLGIAYNVLRKHLEQRMGPRGRIDPVVTSLAELQPASATGVLAQSQARTLVLEAMRSLPLEFQVALELFYWEDMTAPQIGGVLGVPEGTVRSRLRLGRERLRERLAQLDPGADVDVDATVRSTRD
jgi:RNA polymerase sigma-70 factor (ECF subfamily)